MSDAKFRQDSEDSVDNKLFRARQLTARQLDEQQSEAMHKLAPSKSQIESTSKMDDARSEGRSMVLSGMESVRGSVGGFDRAGSRAEFADSKLSKKGTRLSKANIELSMSDQSREGLERPVLSKQLSGDISQHGKEDDRKVEAEKKDSEEEEKSKPEFEEDEVQDKKKKETKPYVRLRPKSIPRRVLLDNMMVVERYLDEEEASIKDKTSDEDSDQKSFKSLSPGKSPDKELDQETTPKEKKKKKKGEVSPT